MKLTVAFLVAVLIAGVTADVTLQQFKCMFPRVSTARATSFIEPLNDVLDEFNINTLDRVAMFLAQTGHETDQYNTFSEYTNADGTNAWCPRYSGGCRYRGRGAIQLTHDYNYRKAGDELRQPFLSNPEMVATLPWAFKAGGLFWKWNNLNSFSDNKDLLGATRKINGGTNGLDDRRRLYTLAYQCLRTSTPTPAPKPTPAPTPKPSTDDDCQATYTVVSGDNLYRIAQRFGVTQQELMDANNISDATLIRVGQVLCIPN